MSLSRLPRFRRIQSVATIELTTRDRIIIRLVYEHRFLRSAHIIALLGGSRQQILRRLKLLYHHGYLERPRCQLDSYHQGGSHPIVYGLGNKGGTLLRSELGMTFRAISWGEKNRAVRKIFLDHAVLVADAMVAIKIACRKFDIRLLTEPELTPSNKRTVRWSAKIESGRKIGVIPDRAFALETLQPDGCTTRTHFFLEADRGTMPVARRNLSQTSFRRKLLAYEATWAQSIHRSKFGFRRFRVLTVTASAVRLRSLLTACSELKRGRGLFLFADRSVLDRPEEILGPVWQTTDERRMESLLD